MTKEIIIDKFGIGNAIAIRVDGALSDLFIDPQNTKKFYPNETVLTVRIERRVLNRGAYFLTLPNKNEGFLRSKKKI